MMHITPDPISTPTPKCRWQSQLSIALAMLALVAAFAAPAAQAKTKTKNHHYRSVIATATLATRSGYPSPGGTAVVVGTWATNLYGNGTLVDHVTITGQPTPTTFSFKGTEVDFVALGSFKDTFTGTATVQSDGSETLATQGRFTGGTGPYRGASGSFKFSGSTSPGSGVVNGHSAGTIIY
jgi:hypothetical protein